MTHVIDDIASADLTSGEGLGRGQRYDFVIVGGGPNALGIAAYLSKWGFSVCILEARPEIGGGAENFEPIPGYSCDPHASFFYGGAGPGPEQLELGRYGFRLSPTTDGISIRPDGLAMAGQEAWYQGRKLDGDEMTSMLGFDKPGPKAFLEFMEATAPHMKELLRSIYWTPPYDERWRTNPHDQPWAKILRDAYAGFDERLLTDISWYEWLTELEIPDPMKCGMLIGAWGNGPHPFWSGMAIPAFTVLQLMMYTGAAPVGGMHALAHALARCALAHGARIFVNSPVSEVIVEDGAAKGVRVSDESVLQEKTVWANLAVIMNTHVRQLPDLVGRQHLSSEFVQRVADLSLKGGSLYVANMVASEFPEFKDAPGAFDGKDTPTSFVLNSSTENMLELMRDVHTFRTHPTDIDHYAGVWFIGHAAHDRTRLRGGDAYVFDMNLQVPAPEDHRDGPDAVNRASDEILANVKELVRRYAPNMTDDKWVGCYVNTPYDSEFRNMGFVGGNWMGMRESEEEWWSRKPLPELARYRTPIEGLYLCNQTSHPGGLCLIAVPYNLMHILHEDYDEVSKTEPDWWYPSPWHVTDEEGGTA